jgi:hypothetical protein
MSGFFLIWGISFFGALIAIPDASSYETWLQRAFRAAGYSLIFSIVMIILVKLGFGSGGDLDIEYRR